MTIAESEPYINQNYIMAKLNEYLMDVYCLYYRGGYTIYKMGDSYTLYIDFLNKDFPVIIAGDFLSDDDFIEYLKKEMRERGLFNTNYFEVTRQKRI